MSLQFILVTSLCARP